MPKSKHGVYRLKYLIAIAPAVNVSINIAEIISTAGKSFFEKAGSLSRNFPRVYHTASARNGAKPRNITVFFPLSSKYINACVTAKTVIDASSAAASVF